jgi:hypothetical protein
VGGSDFGVPNQQENSNFNPVGSTTLRIEFSVASVHLEPYQGTQDWGMVLLYNWFTVFILNSIRYTTLPWSIIPLEDPFWSQCPNLPNVLHCKDRVAASIHANLSVEVLTLITSDEWKGGALILLDDMISRPSATVLARNRMWLRPLVQDCPKRVRGVQTCVFT